MKTHLKVNEPAKEKYRIKEEKFEYDITGDLEFNNLYEVRKFTKQLNDKRDLIRYPELAAQASEVNAISLIHEIYKYVYRLYEEEMDEEISEKLYEHLEDEYGAEKLEQIFKSYVKRYPPLELQENPDLIIEEYLNGETQGKSNREIILDEMIFLWLNNTNPAFKDYHELFKDEELAKETDYKTIFSEDTLLDFFEEQPTFGPDDEPLLDMLLSVSKSSPNSLMDQLRYIRDRWGDFLGDWLNALLLGISFIQEETQLRGLGAGEAQVLSYEGLDVRNYSQDSNWMPKVVMLAKNTYVWLHQLSERYNREISRLDQIPDEELQRLADFGFTALWLIGLWERSEASKTIKRWCGNPEAVASAYSLYDYAIANDLGGPKAYEKLKQRAMAKGIRMASDMVPNHTGIDSKWMLEHPDWFLSIPHKPFPSYSYSGDSLSPDPKYSIQIEDKYFSREDAAVTFKWVNKHTGEVRYIYHGNDGTSMPWNDTAQLDYLKDEVREAVIQKILHVARLSPIIRFDAAMTLAKRHIQRLWFPEPGSGGAIPSRAEHSMTKEEFNKAIPNEFWREVVDRVHEEVPDTLLLAEAFWMLEGYFVRTLGMHRVYNSAFMNMLRDEDNSKYRLTMKNTLEYDPEILKRFVNFMNNPDEETAVNQFGKGDKYFGICVLLSTMPGLPMFGHGQLEGYAEKYGMEYKRSYWDEEVDQALLDYHRRIISPLLKKRYIFAEVKNFLLYDFFTLEGYVNEDVFAYSNHTNSEKALIVYQNSYSTTKGWIKTSVAYKDESKNDLIQKTLSNGLKLSNTENAYCIFRELVSNQEIIRKNSELTEKGMFLELEAYEYRIFMDIREVQDDDRHQYARIHDHLGGRGVENIERAKKELYYESLHTAIKQVLKLEEWNQFIKQTTSEDQTPEVKDKLYSSIITLLQQVKDYSQGKFEPEPIANEIIQDLQYFVQLFNLKVPSSIKNKMNTLTTDIELRTVLITVLTLRKLGKIVSNQEDYALVTRSWFDEYLILNKIHEYIDQKYSIDLNDRDLALIRILTNSNDIITMLTAEDGKKPSLILRELFNNNEIQHFLQFNRYEGVLWFNQEKFELLVDWIEFLAYFDLIRRIEPKKPEIKQNRMKKLHTIVTEWIDVARDSNFQVHKLLDELEQK